MLLELEMMRFSVQCFMSVRLSVCLFPLVYPFPTFNPLDTTHGLYSPVEHSNAVTSLVL